jgi:hypothetical protein
VVGRHPLQGAEVRDGIARVVPDAVAELGRGVAIREGYATSTRWPATIRARRGVPSDTYIVAVLYVRSSGRPIGGVGSLLRG